MQSPKARPQSTELARRSTWWLASSSTALFRGDRGSGRFRVRQRNADHKCAASACLIVPALNFAAVSADNTVADAQPQARSFARMFCGVERIENALRIDDANAVVSDVHFNGVVLMTGSNSDPAAFARFLNGVVGVIQNIQKNLLQLLTVSQRRGQRFIKSFQHFHAMAREIIAAQLDGLAQYIVHTDELSLY